MPGGAAYGKGVAKGKESRMFGLGYQELLLILLIVLILFGAQRLPNLARSLGSSVKEFKKGIGEIKDDSSSAAKKNEDTKA
jgi:sec-independent protein translocase protein TatA